MVNARPDPDALWSALEFVVDSMRLLQFGRPDPNTPFSSLIVCAWQNAVAEVLTIAKYYCSINYTSGSSSGGVYEALSLRLAQLSAPHLT